MEATIRLGLFLGIFAVAAVLEFTVPKRPKTANWKERWVTNISILLIDVVAQRLTIGAAAYLTAIYAETPGWGLFGFLDWPPLVEAVLAFLLLDFAIYLQHVMSHALPVFWRLHQVHHADLDVDITTGTRFHPIEIIVSMIWKTMLVAALGASPWVVVVFEAVLNGFAVFTHGNIRLPGWFDHTLRYLVCTPDMHRIHHSVIPSETDSNYGFFLSVWDRLCGTMRRDPVKGQLGVEIGLHEYRDPSKLGLFSLLLMPFRSAPKEYSFEKLVPRQETETLVELTLELIPQNFVESILDLGTGSGCIAITLKLEMPSLQVSASDISHEAIEVARANAGALSAQVEFVESDRFSGLKSRPFDLIVSNPPYVGIEDGLPREVAEYEPKLSLYGRPLWDSFYRQIAQDAPLVLKGPRIAAVEVGDYQYDRVSEIFIEEGWVLVASKSDLGGMPRAMAFRMP